MHAEGADVALLAARAKRLAAPLAADSAAVAELYLEFTLLGERYAIEAALVSGTFRFTAYVPLPGAAREVVGVSLWRGTFLRVLDLERMLGGARAGLDDRAMVVAVGERAARFGLLVSALLGVGPLPVAASPDRERQQMRPFVRHVTADAVQVLDGRELIRTFG